MLVQVVRWKLLLDHPSVTVRQLLRIHLIGTAAGFFLPSSVAGDVVRTGLLSREAGLLERSLISTLVARLFGLASLMILAMGGAMLWPNPALRFAPSQIALGLAIASLAGAYPAWRLWKRIRRNHDWWLAGPRWRKRVHDGFEYLASLRNPLLLGKVFAYSLLLQACTLLSGWMAFKALSAPVPVAAAFVFQSLLQLGSLAPLTVGGIGVREGLAMVLYHGVLHLPREQCLAAMALGYVISTILCLPGIALFAGLRKRPQ
ncbi:MAG: hypothetical protein RL318_1592 [Fibrobacterota bacterium]